VAPGDFKVIKPRHDKECEAVNHDAQCQGLINQGQGDN